MTKLKYYEASVDNDKKIMIDNKMLNLKTDTAIEYCPNCGRKLDENAKCEITDWL